MFLVLIAWQTMPMQTLEIKYVGSYVDQFTLKHKATYSSRILSKQNSICLYIFGLGTPDFRFS
jgi:hypothetical protein